MRTCKECSSEISEQDTFCPYCGISLQPVAAAQTAQDDSLESTIMMPPEELARLRAGSGTKAESGPVIDIVPEVIEVTASEAEFDEIQTVPAPDSEPPMEEASEPAADVPVPNIISELIHTSENIPFRSTQDYEIPADSREMKVEREEPPETVLSGGSEPASIVSSLEPEFGSSQPQEYPMTERAPAGEIREDAIRAESAPAEVAVVEPSVTEPTESTETKSSVQESIPSPGEEPPRSEAAPVASADAQWPEQAIGERPAADAALERQILKPVDELENHDPFSNSMFDSVRIMENEGFAQPDDVQTVISPDSVGREKIANEAARGAAIADAERSETSPGMSEGDTDNRRASKLKPLAEGTILNARYEIIRKIGGGGMGAVYLASDNNLGGVLRAVKEMIQAHIEDAQQDKAINDFKRESMILSTLDHPSIPTIFDYFYDEAESRFYLVMKYISGGDLSSRLRSAPEGKLDEVTVTEWALQITDVLDYLHSQPTTIVYRDLKPSNIMVDSNSGRVMLIDFGIARSISQKEEKGVTAVGTMGYAPPELFSGNVEPRSDIYSLGSTMFHLLTGADPQSNPLLIFDFQKNPRPRQINSQLSDQMENILMRAVEYNASARFASSAEMRKVLEDHLAKLRAGTVTYGVTEAPVAVGLANQAVFCGFCGQRIVATDLFCAFCGSRQPIAQQGVHSAIYAKPTTTAKLFVEGTGELTAPTYAISKDENLLGRRDPMSNIFPEVDLSKYDPQTKISRRHARIWRDGTRFMVEDLGSSNGTILAPATSEALRLVPHQPHSLQSGDKLKVGDTTLHFLIG